MVGALVDGVPDAEVVGQASPRCLMAGGNGARPRGLPAWHAGPAGRLSGDEPMSGDDAPGARCVSLHLAAVPCQLSLILFSRRGVAEAVV